MMFASPSATGIPIASTRVDAEFYEFFDQLDRWGQNPFYFENTAIEKDWYHYEGKEIVYDYSGFNQDALALAQGALKDVVDDGGIVAGSSDAVSIADIIEGILGTIIYGGVFRDSSVVLGRERDVDEGIKRVPPTTLAAG